MLRGTSVYHFSDEPRRFAPNKALGKSVAVYTEAASGKSGDERGMGSLIFDGEDVPATAAQAYEDIMNTPSTV